MLYTITKECSYYMYLDVKSTTRIEVHMHMCSHREWVFVPAEFHKMHKNDEGT